MKKLFFALTIALLCTSNMQIKAQEINSEYKQVLVTYLKASGGDLSFNATIDQLFAMMGDGLTSLQKMTIKAQALDLMINYMVPVYQKNITLDDLKAMTAFYDTPAGKRIAAAQPQIVAASTEIGPKWAADLQALLQNAK